MLQELLTFIFQEATYPEIFGYLVVYFLLLYFGLGNLFAKVCQLLASGGYLEKINQQPVTLAQIKFEIRHSLISILNFGLSGVLVIYLVRQEVLQLRPDSFLSVFAGLLLLTLWNEIHFFLVHQLMHLPFFMRRVHWVHHRSKVPGIYSVYSFHFLESLLLSTVQVIIMPLVQLSPLTITFFPIVSLLLNLAGHCNYRVKPEYLPSWLHFATRHNQHHRKNSAYFGFALPVLDILFNSKSKRK
jgi:lathosterol oxidase